MGFWGSGGAAGPLSCSGFWVAFLGGGGGWGLRVSCVIFSWFWGLFVFFSVWVFLGVLWGRGGGGGVVVVVLCLD